MRLELVNGNFSTQYMIMQYYRFTVPTLVVLRFIDNLLQTQVSNMLEMYWNKLSIDKSLSIWAIQAWGIKIWKDMSCN